MNPIKVYRVTCRPKLECRRPAQRDHFPTLNEARMWFEDVRQDSGWYFVELEEVVIIPPSREGICTYLNGTGYELEATTLDSWMRPSCASETDDGEVWEALGRGLLER